jgi:DNA-binding transcriptional MerR regulator
MEEEVKKLREAGFSDEDIRAYMEEQKSSSSAAAPIAPVSPDQMAGEPTKADETVPDYGGTTSPSMGETLGTIGAAVAPYALPVAIGGAGLYGASTLKSGFNAMKESAAARTAQANAQMEMAKGIQQRFDETQKAKAAAAAAKEAKANKAIPRTFASTPSTSTTTPTYNVPTGTPKPITNMPAAAPAAVAPQISNARSIVQKLALDKIMPAVGNFANKALPAAQLGMGLFYTSPEEIAILKAAEEKKKRAQGQK